MSTVLGTIRSLNAVIQRAERARQQQVKQATLQFKEIQKVSSIANNAQAVKSWNDYVDILKSLDMWQTIGKYGNKIESPDTLYFLF